MNKLEKLAQNPGNARETFDAKEMPVIPCPSLWYPSSIAYVKCRFRAEEDVATYVSETLMSVIHAVI